MKRRLLSLIAVALVLLGVAAPGASRSATARDEIPIYSEMKAGELTDATAELLAVGVIPSSSPQPAALALQRVRIAPGGKVVVAADDPKVVLFYVESGTLTVRNTVDAVVTRGAALTTPGALTQDAIPAETEFIMRAGDASLSPAGSGGSCATRGARTSSSWPASSPRSRQALPRRSGHRATAPR
jgi:hypothetical protein